MTSALPDDFMFFISPEVLMKRGYTNKEMTTIWAACEDYLTAQLERHTRRLHELEAQKAETKGV